MKAVAPILSMQVAMPPGIASLFERMTDECERITQQQPDPVLAAEGCAAASVQTHAALKALVLEEGFADKSKEITFFKTIKPRFYGRILYYQSLYHFECQKPASGPGLKKYVKRKLKLLSEIFEGHRELYLYLRLDKSHLDAAYFLRENREGQGVLNPTMADADPAFSTAQHYHVSNLIHWELMQTYADECLAALEGRKSAMAAPGKDDIFWTGTLRDMNQLIRSLVKSRSLNNGNLPMSKVIAQFEPFFHVDLRNFYRASQENRIRKDPSDFLRKLLDAHEKDLDDADENPRYR